ncbi:MAG: rhodanese-like domain-containing protein [Chromatiales bacterium]|nr:rhodanese-like domain-containing protein [Chromatiales bacterium]
MLSHQSAFKAEKLGYTNIKRLCRGLSGLDRQGRHRRRQRRLHQEADRRESADDVLIDSRPKARKYDKGHIPGAINIPDTQFDKMADKLPADKATPLYLLLRRPDLRAQHELGRARRVKLGYTNVKVVPEGYPAWVKAYGAGAAAAAPGSSGGCRIADRGRQGKRHDHRRLVRGAS